MVRPHRHSFTSVSHCRSLWSANTRLSIALFPGIVRRGTSVGGTHTHGWLRFGWREEQPSD